MSRNPKVKRIDYYPSDEASELLNKLPTTVRRNRIIDSAVLASFSKLTPEELEQVIAALDNWIEFHLKCDEADWKHEIQIATSALAKLKDSV